MKEKTHRGTSGQPWRVMLGWSAILLLVAGLVLVLLGRSAAEKIVTALVLPCGLLWGLLGCLVVIHVQRGQRQAALLSAALWLLYTAGGNGFVAGRLAWSLESPFRDIDPLQQEPFDVIVVLGGGASTGVNERHQGNGAGDRLILAAQAYHQGRTQKLICTGKKIESMNSSGYDPAEQSADVLLRLGVPAEVIDQVGGRTTSEEMRTLGQRFRESGQRVGVITSAWHLPRALRLARRNGFDPRPLPADFMSGPVRTMTTGELMIACIPQADAICGTTRMVREYLGMLAGR